MDAKKKKILAWVMTIADALLAIVFFIIMFTEKEDRILYLVLILLSILGIWVKHDYIGLLNKEIDSETRKEERRRAREVKKQKELDAAMAKEIGAAHKTETQEKEPEEMADLLHHKSEQNQQASRQ